MKEEKVVKPTSKKGKVVKRIFLIIGWSFIGLLFLISGINVIDRATGYNLPLFGFRTSVIVTSSMSMDLYGTASDYEIKQLQINDVIITKTTSYENIDVGDVITFTSKDGFICHRVVEKYETEGYKYFVTRGDANTACDTPIEMSNVKGKVINTVPKVGGVVAFIQSPYMLIAIGFSGFVIFLSIFVYKYTEDRKEKKNTPSKKKE